MESDTELSKLGELWGEALESGDLERIVGLYADDAIFLPTFYEMAHNRYEIEEYFVSLLEHKGLRVEFRESHSQELAADTISLTGLYTFHFRKNGETVSLPARFTFNFRKSNGEWKIITHHSSECPTR